MFLGSQLTEVSSRFPAQVQEIQDFLRKEKLPVPSPDAIPQLTSRLASDSRFRADVASLMRAALYQQREEIGYEDLLGILVAAAAGTEHDLKSDSQEAEIREMLRFLLQSRRVTFHPESEPKEPRIAVEPEGRRSVPVRVQLTSEPVRPRGVESAPHSKKLELRPSEPPVPVAEPDRREPEEVVLSPFRTTGLFAAHMEPEDSWWKSHSAWIVGVVCMLLGIGLGLTFHRVVSAAEIHLPMFAAHISSKPKTAGPVAPQQNAEVAQTPPAATAGAINQGIEATQSGITKTEQSSAAPVQNEHTAAAPLEGRSTPPPAIAQASPGVPVTVVRQVVTSSPETDDPADATEATAKTRSTVHQGSAGMTPANVVYSPAPEYPAAAAEARVHGEVTVHAVVDPDGKVIYAHAVSGPPLLRGAAEKAVHRWRYSPLLDNGKPIAVTTTAVLDFRVPK